MPPLHPFPLRNLFATVLAGVALQVAKLPAADAPVSWLPGETKEAKDARMAWWTQAKFGMFIHWGLYSIPADGEWRAHLR